MSEFEAGDKVKILDSNCSPLKEGGVYTVHSVSENHHWVMMADPNGGYTYCFHDDCLELVEKKVKRYKIETELCASEIEALTRWLWDTSGFGDLYNKVQKIDSQLKRKVVTIGDKEYYEDELQTALANIKPINL
jgi:hypothetical protein